ncbi:MAG: hypothetical protein ABIU05_00220 [Nitrospirales bacterium]
MPREEIKREEYEEYHIHSKPFEGERGGRRGWKIRIDIIDPPGIKTKSREHLSAQSDAQSDATQLYSTLAEAHTGGLEYGRRLIDERLERNGQRR